MAPWALLGAVVLGCGQEPEVAEAETAPAEDPRALADPPPSLEYSPRVHPGGESVADIAAEGEAGISELEALLTDPMATAALLARGGAARGGGAVVCDAIPGQGDGGVTLSDLQTAMDPLPEWPRAVVIGRRVVAAVPEGSGQVTVTFDSGLSMVVAWKDLAAGDVIECSRVP